MLHRFSSFLYRSGQRSLLVSKSSSVFPQICLPSFPTSVSTNRKGDKKHMMWQNVLPSSLLQASIQKERLWQNNFYSASTSTQ